MPKKGNKYKIGAMALIAVVILVIGLLSLGVMKYFQPEILFLTASDTSVQGLNIGSNVKLKGVTIGSVKNIQIITNDKFTILITMKFNLNAFIDKALTNFPIIKTDFQENFNKSIQPLVDKGLRCQLQYEGITGDLYVDISNYDPKEYPMPNLDFLPESDYPFIPIIPTASIGTILDNVQSIAKKLEHVNINKIADNFDSLMSTINELVLKLSEIANGRKLDEVGNNITDSLDKFNQTMNSLNILIKAIQIQPDSLVWGKAGYKVVPSLNENK
ncbi:MAG TPA: hypothetical protein DD381_00320 [Lentisphaeria bacterium]|nr:MAG: hypothetical protein A2X47_06045 [Lentisphaerae bacterium GWF2_38_69]HBM14786.1 hypothetical protein [Lentisphaeria bacterium]